MAYNEEGVFQKVLDGLSGKTPKQKPKGTVMQQRKGAKTVTMGATCTPKGQTPFPGSTPCPTKPKAAPVKKGVLSSMFGR